MLRTLRYEFLQPDMDASPEFVTQDLGDIEAFGQLDEFPSNNQVRECAAQEDDNASQSGSAHLSSGPDEDIFDKTSQQSSPHTSHPASDLSDNEDEDSWITQNKTPSPYTPLKNHSPFRHPSSVRAMQTDITPPQAGSTQRSQRHIYSTPSRRETPRSTKSLHMTGNPTKMSPGKTMMKEYPLVLLHVTLLPLPSRYSSELLKAALPPTIAANWKVLEEKIAQTVLERGLLIPHPREDYDLLEERLLESLELRTPRILKCGHFHLSPDEEADALELESDTESDTEEGDICQDCGRHVRDGRFGDAGTGSKRWDIKIFAANGLMRAGAWAAAWREMERIDVEIRPWMEENMRLELEARKEEEDRLQIEQEEAAKMEGVAGLDDERLREIYGQSAREDSGNARCEQDSRRVNAFDERSKSFKAQEEVPLLELALNFLRVSAMDWKNAAILFLSIILLLLSFRNPTVPASPATTIASQDVFDPPLVGPVPDLGADAANSFSISDSEGVMPVGLSASHEELDDLAQMSPLVPAEMTIGELYAE